MIPTRNSVLLIVLLIVFSCVGQESKQPVTDFNQYFQNWLNHENLQPATIGILVEDEHGNQLLEYNSKKSLVPASTQKLLTTAAILEKLGPDFQFETKLWYTGEIDANGILNGDIWIEGGADPTLGSERFGGLHSLAKIWLAAIKGAGITSVTGRVRVDVSKFPKYTTPRTWIWEDLGNYYGAVPSGLSFHENQYTLILESPYEIGKLCTVKRIYPEMNDLDFDCQVTAAAGNSDNAYIFGNSDGARRYIQGTIPKARDEFKIKGAISNPEKVAANWLTSALNKNEVKVNYQELDIAYSLSTKAMIYSHKSPKLSEIIRLTNQHSINLYAEHVALWNCDKRGELLSIELAAKNVKKAMEEMKIDTKGMQLVDGSGLSRFNVLTPEQLVDLLQYMKTAENSTVFENSLSVAGESGTLKRMFTGSSAAGKIKAKSGYMERVRSYAGYLETKSGKQCSFSIIINNYAGSAASTKHQIKKMLEEIIVRN